MKQFCYKGKLLKIRPLLSRLPRVIEINVNWEPRYQAQLYTRREYTEHVLFLILNFGESTIQNFWAGPLTAATRTQKDTCIK